MYFQLLDLHSSLKLCLTLKASLKRSHMPGLLTHGQSQQSCKNENEYWQEGCIIRDKYNTDNCSNLAIIFFIFFSWFFILCPMLSTSKFHYIEFGLLYHPQFLSRGAVLTWASRQFSLLPLVSINKRGWFSLPFGVSFSSAITITAFPPSPFLTFNQTVLWWLSDLMSFRECLS